MGANDWQVNLPQVNLPIGEPIRTILFATGNRNAHWLGPWTLATSVSPETGFPPWGSLGGPISDRGRSSPYTVAESRGGAESAGTCVPLGSGVGAPLVDTLPHNAPQEVLGRRPGHGNLDGLPHRTKWRLLRCTPDRPQRRFHFRWTPQIAPTADSLHSTHSPYEPIPQSSLERGRSTAKIPVGCGYRSRSLRHGKS